jgi:hypothetical protein
VGRRSGNPVRDDDARLPEPLRHARAGPASRRDRELHPRLSVVGAEFVARAVAALEHQDVASFEVSADAEAEWGDEIVSSQRPGLILDPCTPSFRTENPYITNPRGGSYGGGLGDYFGFVEQLTKWHEAGNFSGLELTRSESTTGGNDDDN